ncbi:MAG TPA: serine/threonine-protein kinase, partial [Polyangiaceae bacterium]|nr:serine/threonine-protein kinase [Polyangiaceae bacterium]
MQEGKSRARAFSRECSERFFFQNRLGAGSSGCVYRAFDKARQATLAVKVLNEVEPASLYRFKGEFRALTGIVHANLVQLYDLLTLEGDWLLTMELVEGCDFLRYVRPLRTPDGHTIPPSANDADEATLTVCPDSGAAHWQEAIGAAVSGWKAARKAPEQRAPREAREAVLGPSPLTNAPVRVTDLPLDEERLRSALRQLCEGLQALHRANRLHRDLKPANVLVHDRDGRLVICDFGLVTHGTASPAADPQEEGAGIAGTLSYMSPEQATGQPLTEASDWYAVGVMLYQALTGAQPYLGCRSAS